jgi:LacI family transcriptional regulator
MTNNKKRRVTLRKIAEETGYAVVTVSKALRGERDIAEETKRIIREKARELGYIQNAAAAMLRTGRSMLIAISVVDITNPYWSIFCRNVEQLAFDKRYNAIFMNGDARSERERRAVKTMIQRGVDGVILDPSVGYEENIKLLQDVGIPFVLLGCPYQGFRYDGVCFDAENSGYLVGKRLMQRGCKKILYMDIPDPYPVCTDREKGLRRALMEAGFPQEHVIHCRMLTGQGAPVELIRKHLDEHPDIDAIAPFSDFSALQLLSTLQKLNKRVPEDIAVVSIDNIQQFLETGIRLTTVDCSPQKCAEAALNLLLRRIEGDYSDHPKSITLPSFFVEGQTC